MAALKVFNTTGSDVLVGDAGFVIPASGDDTYTDPSHIRVLTMSEDLRALVVAGTLQVSDGGAPFSVADALAYLEKLWSRAGHDEAIQIPDLGGEISDAQHGVRAGGATHPVATPDPGGVAGFMSAADKQKINGLSSTHNDLGGRSTYPVHPEVAIEKYVALVNANTVLDATHGTVLVDSSGAARTITLPTAVGITGRVYKIKKVTSDTNTVTVACNGAETIDGATTFVLAGENNSVTVQSDGTNWRVIGAVFGNDYQSAVSLARSSTNQMSYQNKLIMTTPALRGKYRVGWMAVIDSEQAGRNVEVRLYNQTDAVVIGCIQRPEPPASDVLDAVGGFDEITFTGAAKDLRVQYMSYTGNVVGIQNARIELWRVK